MADKYEPQVRIHVDQRPYQSPSPTTGRDLYELIKVPEDLVLYKEVQGDHEDKLIRVDDKKVPLTPDEHFHTGKPPEKYYRIDVNTEPVVVDHDVLTYEELVKIAFPVLPTGDHPVFTVTFDNVKSKPHEGELAVGGKVTIRKHGSNFDVVHSNRS